MTESSLKPRRFYRTVRVTEAASGFGVALDTRALKTPGGAPFIVPTGALAALCAAEWDAQGEFIVPSTMPISQFAFAALDGTRRNREDLISYVASYAETDLCCHRANSPAELVARQAAAWDSLVAWGAETLSARLPVVTGVMAADIDPNARLTLRGQAAALDDFHLSALAQATGLAGSALIGFALVRGRLTASEAFAAAALDNLWSIEKWGEDAEARARLERQRAEFEALVRYVTALRA
jgi:chaperone required for assembly of F1-ATPase